LDDVPAEHRRRGRGELEVDLAADGDVTEAGTAPCLGQQVGNERVTIGGDDREAHAVDRHRVAGLRCVETNAADGDARGLTVGLDGDDGAAPGNQTGEHQRTSRSTVATMRTSSPSWRTSSTVSRSAAASVVTPASLRTGGPAPSRPG